MLAIRIVYCGCSDLKMANAAFGGTKSHAANP